MLFCMDLLEAAKLLAKDNDVGKTTLKVPKGTSDYQAAWIMDAEEDDDSEDDDDDDDDMEESEDDADGVGKCLLTIISLIEIYSEK